MHTHTHTLMRTHLVLPRPGTLKLYYNPPCTPALVQSCYQHFSSDPSQEVLGGADFEGQGRKEKPTGLVRTS